MVLTKGEISRFADTPGIPATRRSYSTLQRPSFALTLVHFPLCCQHLATFYLIGCIDHKLQPPLLNQTR